MYYIERNRPNKRNSTKRKNISTSETLRPEKADFKQVAKIQEGVQFLW